MNFFKKITVCLLLACLLFSMPWSIPVSAEEASETNVPEQTDKAVDITDIELVTESKGFSYLARAFDGKESRATSAPTSSMTLTYEEGIGSLYLVFHMEYGEYTLVNNDTGAEYICGKYEFLHEFIDLVEIFGAAPSSVTLRFENGSVKIDNIYAFTPGQTPDFVQKWAPPAENETDLILFSAHGDDEQLFFAGLLPYYANAKDYTVQVVYLTDHRNLDDTRVHEMLNGLWAIGCDTYPVFGRYYDFRMESIKDTYHTFASLGWSKEEMLGFVVQQIRRFKPLVAVGHDFAGEYSHGQHMVYAELLAEALTISNDPEHYPESAETYGLWDIPKAYFHLYEENPIVMDWDTPMAELDGMTPFEVTQKLGFPCHVSQHQTWFNRWIYGGGTITKASQIETYNPCLYGLYRSTVGPDTGLNDMFENITPYGQEEEPEPETAPEPEVIPEETEPETTSPTQPAPPMAEPAPAVPKKQSGLWIVALVGVVLAVSVGILGVTLGKRHKKQPE